MHRSRSWLLAAALVLSTGGPSRAQQPTREDAAPPATPPATGSPPTTSDEANAERPGAQSSPGDPGTGADIEPRDAGLPPSSNDGAPTHAGATSSKGNDVDDGTRKNNAPNEHDTAGKQQDGTKRAEGKEQGKKDKAKRDRGTVEIGGRVFAREKLSRESDEPNYTSKMSIASARLDADYRWRALRAVLELELERPRLKDAFVRLRAHDGATRVDVRVGQFKLPFSAIQLESRWRLPLADRGILDQVLVDRLQIAGRRLAAELAIEGRGAWRPTLQLAMFQSLDDSGGVLEAPAKDYFGKGGVVRILGTPVPGLAIGAAGEIRTGGLLVSLPPVVRRAWAAEVDAHLDVPLGPGQLRAWAEAIIGTSWIVAVMDPEHTIARFASARAILAWRAGGASHGGRYIEPYAHVGVLDPDARYRDDAVLEASGGLTYGAWNVWRVGIEAQVWRLGENAPTGIVELGVAPVDVTTVLLQIGARF